MLLKVCFEMLARCVDFGSIAAVMCVGATRAVARILLGEEHLAERSEDGSYFGFFLRRAHRAAENFEDFCTYFVI